MRAWVNSVGFVVALVTLAAASATAAPLTPAQALGYMRIGDLHFSPDGTRLAYVTLSYRDDALPHVWVMDVASGTAQSPTPAKKSERSPQWSADGKTLAFLSNRSGSMQVWLLPVAGGDPKPLTARKNGVSAFRWSPDGRRIAYLAKADDAPDTDAGPQVADAPGNLARLWVKDVAGADDRMIGRPGIRIDDLQWSGDDALLLDALETPRIEEYLNAIYRLSLRDGRMRRLVQPAEPFTGLTVSPDGKHFAVRAPGEGGPVERDLFAGDVARGALHDLSAPTGLAVGEIRWRGDAVWFRAIDGFVNRLYRAAGNAAPVRLDLPLSVDTFDVAADGRIAYAGGDFDHLAELYLRAPDGTIRQLTHLNAAFDGVTLAQTSIFKTKSFDGTEIEAALMMPRDVKPETKLPLVLIVHGGPSSNFSARYGWEEGWGQMLASHGYEVLLVNPRGSNGYSEAFAKANRGDWGGGDFRDLMAVLDAVIARGQTDPARLGIGGWSYGGEMSAWAITQTDRFKAAVAGACVFDQQAEFETEYDGAGDEWYFGTPWEHPDTYARNSPATYIANAHTPTLIFDGLDDQSNPVGQSKGLYRALKHLGVETQMVLYPGEGHSPRKLSYNIDMFGRILAWYDSHLGMSR